MPIVLVRSDVLIWSILLVLRETDNMARARTVPRVPVAGRGSCDVFGVWSGGAFGRCTDVKSRVGIRVGSMVHVCAGAEPRSGRGVCAFGAIALYVAAS